MKTTIRVSLIALCASVMPLSQAMASSTPNYVTEAARTVDGGRAVQVVVGQGEIKSNIEPVVVAGPGLLGALIAAGVASKMEADRAKKAEETITPVRDALSGFDTDGLAISTTKTALSHVDWMAADPVQFSKDSTTTGEGSVLDATTAGQVAFFNYSYDMTADFSSIRVTVGMQFANKAAADPDKPEVRLNKPAYGASIITVVTLPNPDKDIVANATRWAADDGKLIKAALTQGFHGTETLIPRTLALSSEADVKALNSKDKAKQFVGGFTGRLQERDGNHTLIWAGAFIESEVLAPDAPAAPEAAPIAQPDAASPAPDASAAPQAPAPDATTPSPADPAPAVPAPADAQPAPAQPQAQTQ